MANLFSRGVVLEQHKEPALSRDLREIVAPPTMLARPKVEDPSALSAEEILEIAAEAGIIDERDGIALHDKLIDAARDGVFLVAADAMDDEPYVSSQLGPLFKLSQQAVGGLLYAAKVADSNNILIAVYRNVGEMHTRIPNTLYGVRIKRITGKYPVEARARFEKGNVLLIGVNALIHLHRAIHKNIAQTTSFVTVAGNCVANPTNLEVQNGVSVAAALDRCGLVDDPARIVVGGPMTGICIMDPEHTHITPTTRAVLAFRSDVRDRHYSCIGCGKCAAVCPQKLSPTYLYKAALVKHVRLLRLYDVRNCIGCGTCSYVCPAKLDLSATILRAKRMIASVDEQQRRQNERAAQEVQEC